MFTPKNILVPTDFSSFSDAALKNAVDIAKQYQATIYLLHVIDEGLQQCAVDYCLTDEMIRQIEEQSTKTTTEKLQQEVKRIIDSRADVKVSFTVKRGNPSEEIINTEKEKNIDLIVIASHGRTGIMKHLIGSVAENVMRGARAPVLLVRS